MSVEINTKPQSTTASSEIHRVFNLQKENQFNVGNTSVSQRKSKLTKLHKAVLKYRPQIKEALYNDYQKHPSEVDLSEIYPVTSEIKYAKSHIHSWMKDKWVETPLALLGSSSHVKYEPKGVVLIISPWNFPINLSFGPLVGAIAAGNTVIIKPSEITPNASALMKKIISEIFDENEIVVLEGGIDISTELLKMPFNHIFFTGAPSIGKLVMEAAAKHLTSVTLELGGKSPTIIDETANIDTAARRMAWAKYLNNGQICIAPDYLFVHETKKDAFITAFKKNIEKFYSEDASKESSYCRVVNNGHYKRIKSYVDDALSKGATLEAGGIFDENQDYISPTLMSNVSKDSKLMTNEIFGPILPLYTYTEIETITEEIRNGEKPLALYIFSNRRRNINYIMANTRAGGTCINHNAVHFFNPNLPFGGSNNSGIGKGHGRNSFETFSNARAVLKQHIPNALDMLTPPYNDFKQKLIDLTISYF